MLNLDYYQSESNDAPAEVDTASSPTTVYLRKNIRAEQREDIDAGETRTVYVYDEAKVPRQEYDNYLQEKSQADIAYLYLIGGVDYE